MKRPWKHTASSRSVLVLQVLARAPEGLTLVEVQAGLGESGRRSRAAIVTMLKAMRQDDRVDYEVPTGPTGREGRPAGVYRLSAVGAHWLRERGFLAGDDDPLIETGAMRGEVRSVTHGQARAGQVPASAVNWVFSLGQGR